MWDDAPEIAQALAATHGATRFDEPAAIADPALVDVAFVFGRPARMPELARPFIERAIPISMEKPCGLSVEDVVGLEALARARGAHVSVAFIQRHDGPAHHLLRLIEPGSVTALTARFIAGPPKRYREAGCSWLLDPGQSGGGALMNLGVHFVDLALALSGGRPERIACETSSRLHGEAVEDYASLLLRLDCGAMATIEAGYAFPSSGGKRDFRLTVVHLGGYADFDGARLKLVPTDGEACLIDTSVDTDDYYRVYAEDVIAAAAFGAAPRAGLAEMRAAAEAIRAAYDVAGAAPAGVVQTERERL